MRKTVIIAVLLCLSARLALAQDKPVILLINPNSNANATESMTALAQAEAGDAAHILGATNADAPALLKTPADMAAATAGVVQIGTAEFEGGHPDAIIVSAFSDPGLTELRAATPTPVFGIGESVFKDAGVAGRRFAIVTITPDQALIDSFAARAAELGLADQYLGTFVTKGDPDQLLANPAALDAALTDAVAEAKSSGAEAAIMGGGPLSAPAQRIQSTVDLPLVIAVTAATRAALAKLNAEH